jgi:putative ABC transport system permease protein
MILHYLQTGLRFINRYKIHSFINVFGLSIGLAGAMLSGLFVIDEISFDRFHSKAGRIYRINKVVTGADGLTEKSAETSGLFGPTLQLEQPTIEKVVRYSPAFSQIVLSHNDKNYIAREKDLVYTDSTFFDVFDFKLIEGDPKTALVRPNTLVITEEIAFALFGEHSAVGQSILGLEGELFEITGVVKSLPRNSHIQFKGLISWATTAQSGSILYKGWMNHIIPQGIATYVLLHTAGDKVKVDEAFPNFVAAHMPNHKDRYAFYLQPFTELYLNSTDVSGLRMNKLGSLSFITLFTVIAGFVLLIASINYVNISVAKASSRMKEVGMRKSLGAKRAQLFAQFISESIILTLVAFLLAVVLLIIALPHFNSLLEKSLMIESALSWKAGLFAIGLLATVSLLAGGYPGVVLSSFKPITSLKGTFKSTPSGALARQVLIMLQFCISIAIVAGTLFIYQQIKLILNRDLGFNKENVLVVRFSSEVRAKQSSFADHVRMLPHVQSVSLSNTAIGSGSWSTFVIPEGFNPNEVEARMFPVDHEFATAFALQMSTGRFFSPQYASDSSGILINEAMQRRLNWNDPLNKSIKFSENGPAYRVIGLVKDFHFKSLYEKIEPMIMFLNPEGAYYASVRFTGNPSSLLTALEKTWKTFDNKYPFNYYFVDHQTRIAYQSEEKLLKAVQLSGIISIILSCLGLYGVVSIVLEQRTKEIGIRKVLGATIVNIVALIGYRFVGVVLLSGLAAIPLVVWFIDNWLAKFIIKTNIEVHPFIISIVVIAFLAFLTILSQIWRVSKQNPTVSLKEM